MRIILFFASIITWEPIEGTPLLVDFIKSIILILITSCVSAIVASKVLRAKITSSNLKNYGIVYVGSHGNARLRKKDLAKLFGLSGNDKPSELCFFYINGYSFINAYFEKYVVPLAQKGCRVKVLICDYHNSHILNDEGKITVSDEEILAYYRKVIKGKEMGEGFLDRSTAILADKGCFSGMKSLDFMNSHNHVKQSLEITEFIKKLNEENSSKPFYKKIEIRYYIDEFRNPLTIAKYANKKVLTRVWTNLLSPIQEAVDSINVYAEQSKTDSENDSASFVTSCVASFDYVWDRYKETSTT